MSSPEINTADGPVDESFDDVEDKGLETKQAASGFPQIKKLMEETGHKAFEDPAYYKSLLSDGGESATRLHKIFQKYATTTDPKDKTVFKQQLSSVYWDFATEVAHKAPTKLSDPQKFFLRFGMLHPNLLNAESKTFLSKLIVQSDLNQSIYYLDEWMQLVGTGQIKISSTDEVQVKRGNENAHLKALLEKAQGKLEGATGMMRAKDADRHTIEQKLLYEIKQLIDHSTYDDFPGVRTCYTDAQKNLFTSISNYLRDLSKTDREISSSLHDAEAAQADVNTIRQKMEASGGANKVSVDLAAIDTEFGSVRQMAKMTVGRQGNSFPILSGEYFRSSPAGVGFKENVISKLSWIESIDSDAFVRVYKNQPSRIVPYVIILPTYGDFGMCWEPFDKTNRATSRGRIAVPMYPKNLTVALLYAVGDLRWQAAKEKASSYWMEEGLTGNYYQWFQSQKLKGDVKAYFIQDYINWMTKESEGTQKLDKEIRGTFWRFMPFTQAIKEKLKDRSLIYQELYQRDKNREKSDGY